MIWMGMNKADIRAATPSNAAQLIVPDKNEVIKRIRSQIEMVSVQFSKEIERNQEEVAEKLERALETIEKREELYSSQLAYKRQILAELDPGKVLQRGYALVRGALKIGETIEIETSTCNAKAEVVHVKSKV